MTDLTSGDTIGLSILGNVDMLDMIIDAIDSGRLPPDKVTKHLRSVRAAMQATITSVNEFVDIGKEIADTRERLAALKAQRDQQPPA